MFLISNRIFKKFNSKFDEYYILTDDKTFVHEDKNYYFAIEGQLYPDIKYEYKDMVDYFIKSDISIDFKKFRGKYSGVFISKKNKTILAFNDQIGLRDLFYFKREKNLIISNSFSEILKHKSFFYDDVDIDAINEFLVFEYPLRNDTFINDIKILSPATIYSFKEIKIQEFHYWKFELVEEKNFNENKAIETLDKLFYKSMARIKTINGGEKTYGLGLSGGRDSRLVAYYALKNNIKLKTFIFGESNSDAFYIAKKIARKLQIPLKDIEYDEKFVKYSQTSIDFNPMMSILYTWYYSVYKELPYFDVLLTGFLGDIFGTHLKNSKKELETTIYEIFNEINFDLNKIKNINKIKNYQINLDNNSNEGKLLEFDLKQRQTKFIKNNPSLNFFGLYEGVSIFEDIEIVEFCLKIPSEWMYDLKFYKLFVEKKLVELKNIRNERDLFFDHKFLRFFERIVRILEVKIFKTQIFYKKPHKEVQKWLKSNDFFYNYCKDILDNENQFFYKNFNYLDLNKELNLLYNGKGKNYHLFFRLLTIKIWLDHLDRK